MNRNHRATLAQETLEILNQGFYSNPAGEIVNLQPQINHCVENTRYYSPEDLDFLLNRVLQLPPLSQPTQFEIQNETTLEGTKRLALSKQFKNIVALNFASAKNPGGGSLSGTQAQEESLARGSALYSSLLQAPDYYEYHRTYRSTSYSHRMILSPNCPIFRDDKGELLLESYSITFITSAAPNARNMIKQSPEEMQNIPTILRERAARVLALAVDFGTDVLVLGAWGCGVFGNDPQQVAEIFYSLFQPGGEFENRFSNVLFSVLDTSKNQSTYQAFHEVVNRLL